MCINDLRAIAGLFDTHFPLSDAEHRRARKEIGLSIFDSPLQRDALLVQCYASA